MINWKSISLAIFWGLSNSFLILSNSLKAEAQVLCTSNNSKIDFETTSYWVSIQCQAGKLYYHSSEKESQISVKVPAIYDAQTDTYIAQNSLNTYAINVLSLNIYQRGHNVVKEPVLNIYTNSKTSDLDFFNPNRKVAANPLNINPYENDRVYIDPIH
jgi:hypothetical protein